MQSTTIILSGCKAVKHLSNLAKTATFRPFSNTATVSKLTKKIGFIGDGNMAKAICKAIETKGLIAYSQVYVSSPYPKYLADWKRRGANVYTDNAEVATQADIIFLAVKPVIYPQVMDALLKSEKIASIKNKLFVSILAGIKIKNLEEAITKFEGSRVIRVMPNTPMMVGAGCSAYCPGKNVTTEDLSLLKTILEICGVCEQIPEHSIDAAGAVFGSGPAFVYLFIDALSDGGVRMGIHRDIALKFAAQTVLGAAKMVQESGKHVGELKDQVCSAGGMTIAGVHALESGRVRGAVIDAVEAATLKAHELGKSE